MLPIFKQKRERLTNIQWAYIRHFAQGIFFSVTLSYVFLLITLTSFINEKQINNTWDHTIGKYLPMLPHDGVLYLYLIILLAVSLVISLVFGYVRGNLLKKRLEMLLQSIMRIERGNLSTRVPEMGEDEIGQIGNHINEMTMHIQDQVTSLQKLSSDNALLAEQVKETTITEERGRIARDLHDAVSQQLFAISMTMSALSRTILVDQEKAIKQANLVEEMAAAAQSEMRALLLHLRPAKLDGKNLQEGLNDLLSELKSKHDSQLEFHWKIEALPANITKGIEDHLFRIIQEAMSNVLRHAKATKVEVLLNIVDNQIRLKITDNGIGFAEEKMKSASYGLKIMKERAAEIGGVYHLSTAPNKGTMVEVNVPVTLMEM